MRLNGRTPPPVQTPLCSRRCRSCLQTRKEPHRKTHRLPKQAERKTRMGRVGGRRTKRVRGLNDGSLPQLGGQVHLAFAPLCPLVSLCPPWWKSSLPAAVYRYNMTEIVADIHSYDYCACYPYISSVLCLLSQMFSRVSTMCLLPRAIERAGRARLEQSALMRPLRFP